MAFQSQEHWALPQRIADNSATQLVTIGTIIRAFDSDYGVGEFIYLRGCCLNGSWLVGHLCGGRLDHGVDHGQCYRPCGCGDVSQCGRGVRLVSDQR